MVTSWPARLAEAHLDAAYHLATFILAGDRAEAEDAVHDAALLAWEHVGDANRQTGPGRRRSGASPDRAGFVMT